MPKRYKDIRGDGGSNIAAQVSEQHARLRARLAEVRAVVAVVSGKGGVGKSSLTANLAACWALDGRRVGVLDADLNGPTMATMLGVRGRRLVVGAAGVTPPEGALGIRVMSMDLLLPSDDAPLVWEAPTQAESHTWRGAMEANALREFLADTAWGALDILLLDLPPGTDRLVTVASILPVLSGTIVVTIPSDVSHLVVRKSITIAAQAKAPVLGLVENMSGLFPGPSGAELARAAGIPFLGAVPFDPALAAAADLGKPLVMSAPNCDASRALLGIAATVGAALAQGESASSRPSRPA
jgi:ATP-binding protein involved in chromosome partitioning